jgi:hypothetical protein
MGIIVLMRFGFLLHWNCDKVIGEEEDSETQDTRINHIIRHQDGTDG